MSIEPLIAIDTRELEGDRTGIRRFVINLFETAAQLDFPFRFAALSRSEIPELANFEKRVVSTTIQRRPHALLEDIFSFARAEVESRRAGTPWRAFFSPYYKLPYRVSVPMGCAIHDLTPLHFGSGLEQRYFRRRVAHAVGRADSILTASEHARAEIARHFGAPPERIGRFAHAIAPHFDPTETPGDSALRQRKGIESPYLLWVGNRSPHKNLGGLLDAYAQLDASLRAQYGLVVNLDASALGEECDTRGVPEAVRQHIHAAGEVTDHELASLYRGATLFVFPSLTEGFGLPPLEAMACGVPVAVARAASLPEVVGDAGLYFDPRDPSAIARSIEAGLGDAGRETRTRAGLARARQYRLPEVMRPVLETLETLAGTPR